MRPQRFDTTYLTAGGCLMVMGETFVVLIRMSDGYCKRLTYTELGF